MHFFFEDVHHHALYYYFTWMITTFWIKHFAADFHSSFIVDGGDSISFCHQSFSPFHHGSASDFSSSISTLPLKTNH